MRAGKAKTVLGDAPRALSLSLSLREERRNGSRRRARINNAANTGTGGWNAREGTRRIINTARKRKKRGFESARVEAKEEK